MNINRVAVTSDRWDCIYDFPKIIVIKREYDLIKKEYIPNYLGAYEILDPKSICKKCGHPLTSEGKCSWCSMDPQLNNIDRIYPLGKYSPEEQSLLKSHILELKNNKEYAIPLGYALALLVYNVYPELLKADYIVPVPQNVNNTRSFNQALEIAAVFSYKTKIPVLNILEERRDISLQGLTRNERFEKVKGNYYLKSRSIPNGNSVILIDEVVTSGATANECAALLKDYFKEVYVLVPGRDIRD